MFHNQLFAKPSPPKLDGNLIVEFVGYWGVSAWTMADVELPGDVVA